MVDLVADLVFLAGGWSDIAMTQKDDEACQN